MPNAPPTLAHRVVREWPHDASHFTQGLELFDGTLLESIGHYAQSALLVTDLRSARVLDQLREKAGTVPVD